MGTPASLRGRTGKQHQSGRQSPQQTQIRTYHVASPPKTLFQTIDSLQVDPPNVNQHTNDSTQFKKFGKTFLTGKNKGHAQPEGVISRKNPSPYASPPSPALPLCPGSGEM
jgi:hypothetical protein